MTTTTTDDMVIGLNPNDEVNDKFGDGATAKADLMVSLVAMAIVVSTRILNFMVSLFSFFSL